tara:strand:- start:163 stop:480 length:318 start_codon:yes stop_codon:yes gene_type:complete
MSSITIQNLNIKQGDDATFSLLHSDDNGPINLTGYTIVFDSSSEFLTQDAAIIDAVNGTYSLTFLRVNTAQLTRSSESYEVFYYPAGLSGVRATKFKGTVLVDLD